MNQSTEQIARQFANAHINKELWDNFGSNIKVYGAKGDGISNDSYAIQQADSAGLPLLVPDGVYISTYRPVNPVFGPGIILVNGMPAHHDPGGMRSPFFEQYRKRIALKLPLRPPNYSTIISTYGYSYIYPQAVTLDETANELFIVYSASGGSNAWQWVAVYDWPSGTHKCTFSAGSNIGEGAHVAYVNGTRYIYLRGDTTGTVSRYDITVLPADLARLSPAAEFAVDLQYQFTGRNGAFFIESNTHPVGNKLRRNVFTKFSDNLAGRTGDVSFNIFESGDLNEYAAYIPKRQSLAAGDGFFAGGYGGFYQSGETSENSLQGIRLFSGDGKCLKSCLLDPGKTISILSSHGVNCTRIENEGIFVSKDNRIFTLSVTQDAYAAISATEGIVIFEELSSSPDAIDFLEAAAVPTAFPDLTAYYPKRTQGNAIYNPVTGAKFNTLNEIMDFMAATDCRTFDWYTTSATGITDLSGVAFPGSSNISVFNMNNGTFFYSLRSTAKNEFYLVNGAPRVATRAMFPMEFRPATVTDPAANGDVVFQRSSNTQLVIKMKGTDGVVRSSTITFA